jgi:hypothetical protein
MADSGKIATFQIKIDANAASAEKAAKDLEGFRTAIRSSKDAIENYRMALRAIKGTSDEAKKSRVELKSKIDLESNAIGKANIGIRKAQTEFNKLRTAGKALKVGMAEAATASKGLGDVVTKIGGPLADAKAGLASLGEVLELCVNPTMLLTVAAAVLVTGIIAAGVAFVGATVALAGFMVESANALRAMGLMREAATGSAQNAENFGTVIDDLSDKLATPKAKLNDLAVALGRTLGQSKLSGQGIEDTFTAVASASEAMGDETGRALQAIIDRGKTFGRTGIGLRELTPHGLKFENVAANLAKNLHISMAKARLELLTSTANVNEVAKALKESVNARFGEVNAKKLLDLNVILAKFHENLEGLTKGFQKSGLEPVLALLKSLADRFSDTTSTGHSLQIALTAFGTALGTLATASGPAAGNMIDYLVNGFLHFIIWTLKATNAIIRFSQSATDMAILKGVLIVIAAAAGVTAAALGLVAVILGVIVAAGVAAVGAIGLMAKMLYDVVAGVFGLDWGGIGTAIVQGIASGIESAWEGLKNTVTNMANKVKDVFANAIGAHSPATAFMPLGRAIPQGVAAGVVGGTGEATQAVATMAVAAGAAGGSAGGSATGGSKTEQHFIFQISGTGSPEATAELLQSPSLLGALTHAVEIANRGLGFPIQTPAGG